MTEELKPCPFCGSKKKSLTVLFDELDYLFACCYHCHARGPKKNTVAKAISAWNKRK